MFVIKTKTESKLDARINTALDKLEGMEETSDDYGTVVERVSKLHKLKSEEGIRMPSLDTALVVGANIFGILWLTRFERDHVIKAPNAFKMVMKPR
jgi:hypothetical protein